MSYYEDFESDNGQKADDYDDEYNDDFENSPVKSSRKSSFTNSFVDGDDNGSKSSSQVGLNSQDFASESQISDHLNEKKQECSMDERDFSSMPHSARSSISHSTKSRSLSRPSFENISNHFSITTPRDLEENSNTKTSSHSQIHSSLSKNSTSSYKSDKFDVNFTHPKSNNSTNSIESSYQNQKAVESMPKEGRENEREEENNLLFNMNPEQSCPVWLIEKLKVLGSSLGLSDSLISFDDISSTGNIPILLDEAISRINIAKEKEDREDTDEVSNSQQENFDDTEDNSVKNYNKKEKEIYYKTKKIKGEINQELKTIETKAEWQGKYKTVVKKYNKQIEYKNILENFIKSQNKKIKILSCHIEKLIKILKIENNKKYRLIDENKKLIKDYSQMERSIEKKHKFVGLQQRTIHELTAGSKILEDQLRLMDEKFLDLRAKLDMTRDQLTKDIKKAKKEAQNLRTKFAILTDGKESLDLAKIPTNNSNFVIPAFDDTNNINLKPSSSTGDLKNKNFVQQLRVTIADSVQSPSIKRPISAFPSPSKSLSSLSSSKQRPKSAFRDLENMNLLEKEKLLHSVITKINQKDEKVRAASKSGWTADRLFNLLG